MKEQVKEILRLKYGWSKLSRFESDLIEDTINAVNSVNIHEMVFGKQKEEFGNPVNWLFFIAGIGITLLLTLIW